jgi:hypothetical protein
MQSGALTCQKLVLGYEDMQTTRGHMEAEGPRTEGVTGSWKTRRKLLGPRSSCH